MLRIRIAVLGLIVTVGLALPLSAYGQSGHTSWGPWNFDWEVVGNRGLGIKNVRFNDRLFIYKANLPVIRVKYIKDWSWEPWNWNGCGPYEDRIDWGSLRPTTCSASKICQRSFSSGGANWLELGAYARIGKYHIYQVWYFADVGQISARVFSKGLSCKMDHDHHPYWRLDVDADGASSDQIIAVENVTSRIYRTEQNGTKFPPGNKRWLVRDQPTGRGIWVFPGSGDGFADGFSTKDVGPRRYRSSEDENWPFGAWGHLGYNEGENINAQDVVLWYAAHMKHLRSEGEVLWHVVGPDLVVQP